MNSQLPPSFHGPLVSILPSSPVPVESLKNWSIVAAGRCSDKLVDMQACCRNDGTPKIPSQRRSELRDVTGHAGVVLWQISQTIGDIVVIRAVKFIRGLGVRMVAPQRPQYRAGNEQQSESASAGKDFAGQPRDPRALCCQTQRSRVILS
jgi:hypothetical protein